ncbi:MAG: aminoglycoside 6-adenylyltransferase [Firmicutes bacterium]|nr:aminoglycoside 6-adenylyltransferase [Bacillota bacterium]
MRKESEMLALIRRTAQNDGRIRAAWLNGSRANPAAQRDALQDYDVVFVVSELAPLCSMAHWEQQFGAIAVAQEPDDSVLFPGEAEEGRYAFLMQFADGVRIDLTLMTVEKAARNFGTDGQTLLLLDKDGALPALPAPTDREYWIRKPDERRFAACCNEFYWVAPYAAKGLWRGELLYSLEMLNSGVRPMLIRMLEWKAGILTGFSCSAGKCGKLLPKLLPEEDAEELLAVGCRTDAAEQWDALERMMRLFGRTARFVAQALHFTFREEEERGSRRVIAMIKEDRLFASEAERAAFAEDARRAAFFDPEAPLVTRGQVLPDPAAKPAAIPLEVERKFALSGFPDLPERSRSRLRQGYLSTSPVVRIRSRETPGGAVSCRICVKGRGGLVRTEVEQEISLEKFQALCTLLPAEPVEKEQRTYTLPDGHVLECNCVEQGKYWYAEVEFASEQEAAEFVPPAFLGEELTGRPGFSMSEYWNQKLKGSNAE